MPSCGTVGVVRKLVISHFPVSHPSNSSTRMAAEIDFQWQSFPAGSGSSRCRLRLLQLLDFIAVLLILTTCRHLVCLTLNDSNNLTNASLSYDPYLLDQLRYFEIELQRRKLPRWKRCSSSKFSRDDSFEFNISSNSGNEWRLLDRTVAEAHDRLRGRILFLLGDTYQASDIDMRIVSRSDDLDDLDNLHFSSGPSTFTMEYNLEDRASTICTEVSIVAYLRPLPKPNVKIFDVWTSSLDVAFDGDLNWEFGNLTVHSTYGNTWMGNYGSFDPPIIHNMSVSSVYGRIFGGYVLTLHVLSASYPDVILEDSRLSAMSMFEVSTAPWAFLFILLVD